MDLCIPDKGLEIPICTYYVKVIKVAFKIDFIFSKKA